MRPRYTWNMPGSLPPAVLLRPPEIEPEDNILGVGRVLATDGPDAPQQEDSFGGGWALGEVCKHPHTLITIRSQSAANQLIHLSVRCSGSDAGPEGCGL